MTNLKTLYIDSEKELTDFLQNIRSASWVAVDTEFMRERNYYPRLCLIQIATPDVAACIDTQGIKDISELLDLLYDQSVLKVFHSGSQDLEVIHHVGGQLPAPIFDTQLAAPLLGYQEQIGYARLVGEILDVHLSKSHTRADWSHRPLSEAEIKYAMDDVVYLSQIYPVMKQQLEDLQRLQWMDEEIGQLTDIARYQNNPQDAWRRLKMAKKLDGKSLSVLQGLAQWREELAQSSDLPRRWVMKDDLLIDLARRKPADMKGLSRIRGMQDNLIKKYGDALVQLIQDGRDRKPVKIDAYQEKIMLSNEQNAVVDVLSAVVHQQADLNKIAPTYLAPRKHLEKLVATGDDERLLSGWRKELVGDSLISIMEGDAVITIKDGKLNIQGSEN